MTGALAIAERFLAPRPRTRAELVRRLRRANAPDGVIKAALDRLEQLGYVDDAAFARYWIEQRDAHAPRGRPLLTAELRRLGVTAEVIDQALATRDDERAPADTRTPGDGEHDRAAAALERFDRRG
ncbi:MAG: recombination regulator RecX, partial [Chloroflexota bacterium]|nr:recombination regulator RecX [Chloroflexota bacterium]